MAIPEGGMQFEVKSREEGPWSVVELTGEVDLSTAPRMRESIGSLIERGRFKIVLDLREVTFMDSTGLGTLVGILKRLREHQGMLALAGANRPVQRVLSITGLDKVFPLYDSVSSATETP